MAKRRKVKNEEDLPENLRYLTEAATKSFVDKEYLRSIAASNIALLLINSIGK